MKQINKWFNRFNVNETYTKMKLNGFSSPVQYLEFVYERPLTKQEKMYVEQITLWYSNKRKRQYIYE